MHAMSCSTTDREPVGQAERTNKDLFVKVLVGFARVEDVVVHAGCCNRKYPAVDKNTTCERWKAPEIHSHVALLPDRRHQEAGVLPPVSLFIGGNAVGPRRRVHEFIFGESMVLFPCNARQRFV